MSYQTQKMSNRILAMLLVTVVVVGMLPMSVFAVSPSTVETDLGSKRVVVGEYIEFTVTTTANDDLNTMVLGYLDFNGGDWSVLESLQYKESKDGNWYDLPQGVPFGPAGTGFPMSDATSTFRVKFKTAGTYSFSVSMKTVDGGDEICSLTQAVTASVKPSEITTDIAEKSFVVGVSTEFSFTSIPNGHADEYVYGKFTFSDWEAVETLEYWGVTEDMWMPLPKDVLFGPPDTGFPMTNATTRLRVTFNKAGNYSCAVALVKQSDTSVALCSVEKDITVTETIPPVVEGISGNPENWSQSATVIGTVSDQGGSGVQKVVYSKDSVYAETHTVATLSENTFSFEVKENATYYVWAIDGNGNVSEAKTIVIDKIDTTLPELEVQVDPNSWTNGDVKIDVSASDENGVTIKYNTEDSFDDAVELSLVDGKADITVSGEYNGNYYVWAVDTAGNKITKIVTVMIDTTEPTVTITTIPSETWTNEDVTIEGIVEDNSSENNVNSGIDKVIFGTDVNADKATGEATLTDSKYSFTVSENGVYNIWAVDKAGNYSEIATIEIKTIDKIAPVINNVNAPNGWYNKDVVVNVNVFDDGGSGIEKVVYSDEPEYTENLSEASLDSEGKYTFTVSKKDFDGAYYVWVVDKAGNVSEVATAELHMDTTKPTVDGVEADTDVWTNESVTVEVEASDKVSKGSNSGVAKVVYNTNGTFDAENSNATLNDDGTYSFVVENDKEFNGKYYIWAIDNAGNISEAAEVTVLIDTTAPEVDEIEADPNVVTNGNVTVSGKVSDAASDISNSGVEKVVYSTNKTFGTGLNVATLNEDGTYSFVVKNDKEFNGVYYVWAIDCAGNHNAVPAEVSVHIDTTAPEASIAIGKGFWNSFLEAITFGLYYTDSFNVTIVANDYDSGVKSVDYLISNTVMTFDAVKNTAEWNGYTDSFSISAEGNYLVYARVIDNAGNLQYFSSDGVVLDERASNIELNPSEPAADNGIDDVFGYYNGDVTIDISVNDAEPYSGIKTIEYWITKDDVKTESVTLYSFGYDGNYDSTKSWEIIGSDIDSENDTYTGIPTQSMLKKSWAGQIVVSAEENNSCDVVVTVQVTDNAGNVSQKEVKLDIDNMDATAPTVVIEYTNKGTKYNGKYFDGNRTAVITITEREHHFIEPTVYVNETVPEGATNYIYITAVDVNGDTVEYIPTIEWIPTVDPSDADKTVYVATIKYDVDANYTFDIKVTDKATNTCGNVVVDENDAPYEFTVDKVGPEGSLEISDYSIWDKIVESLTFGIYSKDSFDVNATAVDATSPIKVEYHKVSGDDAPVVANVAAITEWTEVDLKNGSKIHTIEASEQCVIYLRITDMANHVYYVSTDGVIVENLLSGITLTPSKPAADNGIDDVFGYYNGDVTINISVNDAEPYSGIKTIEYWITKDDVKAESITLYSFGYDGNYDSTKSWKIIGSDIDSENDTYTGIPTQSMLKKSWAGEIIVPAKINNSSEVVVTVQVTDNAGNVSTKEVKLDIDTTLPTVSVEYDNHDGTQHNGLYYNGNRTATIVITERENHFVKPTVYINEQVPEGVTNYIHITAVDGAKAPLNGYAPSIVWDDPQVDDENPDNTTHTAVIEFSTDANYTFDIKVTDAATNVNSDIYEDLNDAPYEFTVDKVEPQGTVVITTTVKSEVWDDILGALTFGLYDATHIDVKATAKDITSPVKVEYYKATGASAANALTDSELKDLQNWTLLVDGKCVVDTTDVLTVKDYEQFVMYLKLTDYAGNVRYIRSGGAILDNKNPEVEKIEPQITITPSQQPINGIYNTDVLVDVKVNEIAVDGVYSGLKSVIYEIYNHSVSSTVPSQEGTLVDFTNKTPAQSELIPDYEGLGAIKVEKDKNNSNNVEIKVIAIDNAENRSEKSIFIKIDTTAPTIDISYNNNAPDSGRHYSADRTATIVITERNFSAEDVIITITNTDGTIPTIPVTISDWTEVIGTENLDDTTYTATITYNADGDYTFAIECTDLAGWTCGNVADKTFDKEVVFADGTQNPTEFTVDKTAPVISVSYDNNSAQNEKYFNANRTATITIIEHNFPMNDIARVVFKQTTDRGGVIPTVVWNHNGDTHIATFNYSTDGDYTFDVGMTDLAGNASAEANYGDTVAGKDFVIDTTFEDMISQEGVENGVAYGHDAVVVPNITISDINLQEYKVTLVGVQKDKTIDLTEEVNALLDKGEETVTGIFDIFETKQDLDGIYTLTMTSKDKAGNEDSMEIVFTVNRFGSVYVYEEYLIGLIANGGSYVYSVDEDLIITEYNADKLVTDSLKIEITVDGKPLDNVEFTVTPEINDTVSVGSSGWYQYRYTISKDNFKSDGVYKISVSSKDATGNTPENSNYEDMVMNFRVDSTQAEITSIIGLEEAVVNAQNVTVKYTVFDTIGIKSIKVYVDGQLVDEITDFSEDMNNYNGQFVINEQSAAQSVRIVVEDMSGNITDTSSEEFTSAYEFNDSVTVSTNFFVRWYATKWLFWSSIAGAVIIIGAIIFLIAAKRKKNEEK